MFKAYKVRRFIDPDILGDSYRLSSNHLLELCKRCGQVMGEHTYSSKCPDEAGFNINYDPIHFNEDTLNKLTKTI